MVNAYSNIKYIREESINMILLDMKFISLSYFILYIYLMLLRLTSDYPCALPTILLYKTYVFINDMYC